MDGAKVAVLEESDHEGFRSFLKSQQRLGRPTVGLYRHVVTYFPDKASKGKLAQEEIRGFLVLSNLLQSSRSRPVPSLLLGSSRGRFRGLPSGRRRASRSRCLPPLEEKGWKELSSETRHICQSEREQNDSRREGSGQEAERRCREARRGEREVLVSVPGKTRARAIDSKLGPSHPKCRGRDSRERGGRRAPDQPAGDFFRGLTSSCPIAWRFVLAMTR